MLLRRVARPLLASVFVSGGLRALLDPEPRAAAAAPLLDKAGEALPIDQPPRPMAVVQATAAVNVAAGSLLAAGYAPRLASAALVSTLVPTTLVEHPFWREQDPAKRAAQRALFYKNLGLLGGLLLAAADTHGRPSLGWWARRAARRAGHAAQQAADTALYAASAVADSAQHAAETAQLAGRVRSAVR